LVGQYASDCGGRLEVFEAGHVFRGGHYPGFTGKSGAGLVTIITIIMLFYVSLEFNKGRIPVVVGAQLANHFGPKKPFETLRRPLSSLFEKKPFY
jgi:hypothetical protein